MHDFSRYKQVIFDCDGVILDSNDIKSNAFARSLVDEDKGLVKQFIAYHKKNGGVSRFKKFEYFFKNIKSQKKYKNSLNNALDKYAKLSYEGLLNSTEVKGVRSILVLLNDLNIESFVVSGGEQNEVRAVLKSKNLDQYFKEIYGSPITKEEHLLTIRPTKSLYFGDAKSDYIAAKKFGMDFIYISGVSDWEDGKEFCQSNNIDILKDFSDLELD
jgi:phosphoglycolate phosphatase-like HAD superfamily hydrolase